MKTEIELKNSIKQMISLFIISLLLSGLTAFPIETELQYMTKLLVSTDNELSKWVNLVYKAVTKTNVTYPFIMYGTDWLAFAHIVIAIAFVGPLKEPVRNIWVIEFSMIACVLIFPLAFVCGAIRGIPFYWQLIDCSFGVFGVIPLALCRRKIKALEKLQTKNINPIKR